MVDKDKQKPLWLVRPEGTDKRVLLAAANRYDAFLVDATLPDFVCNIVRNTRKPFIVNPMLHVFSRQPEMLLKPETGEVKIYYQIMAREYGKVFQEKLGKESLTILDYRSMDMEKVSENILHFQDQKCSGQLDIFDMDQALVDKYQIDSGAILSKKSNLEPSFYLAPYLCHQEEDDGWYDLSLKFAQSAIKVAKKHKIYAVIFLLPKELDDNLKIDKIVNDYAGLDVGGYILWVNDLSQTRASVNQLIGFKYLVTCLRQTKKPVINLYGGYFSGALKHFGLTGFASGLARSEVKHAFKPFFPVKKFIRQPNYYIYKAHRPVNIPTAEKILTECPSMRCSCAACDGPKSNSNKMAEPNNASSHFVNVRCKEVATVSAGLNTVVKDLNDTIGELNHSKLPEVKDSKSILTKWKQALEE